MNEQLQLLPGYLSAHIGLTLAALAVGVLVSVPLGILVRRTPRLEPVVMGMASVIQTVPSLALLAMMVAVFAALGVQSIGYFPALVALCLYSMLPILRNTVVSLASIDPALIEAAQGVGMTRREQLLGVELPLALPVMIAGVRTAAVWTVGTATLATPVGATCLGNYIFSGLQTRNYAAVLVGCVASALLALLLDGLVLAVEVGLRTRRRVLWALALCAFAGLAAWPIAGAVLTRRAAAPVRIGGKFFTEQYVLTHILANHITAATGRPARILGSLGSTVAFDALRAGQIDVYVDYSGTIWATILRRAGAPGSRAAVLEDVRRSLPTDYGVEVVAALGFENTIALALRRADAERLRVRRISDLAPHAPSLTIAADYEFFQRPESRAVERTYGLSFKDKRTMEVTLMYEAARSGGVDVISAYSTDGRIAAFDLVVLEDDRGAIPPYDAVVLVNAKFARLQPAVVESLRALSNRIDAAQMRRMNAEVDGQGRSPAEVAEVFLRTAR